MARAERGLLFVLIMPITLCGCGLYVPEKDIFISDAAAPGQASAEGMYEQNLVNHIRCEIGRGLFNALGLPNQEILRNQVPWISGWQVLVTLKITADEQAGLSPGVSFLKPLVNMQSFTLGLGASGSAHATRVETISFTYLNKDLLDEAGRAYRDNRFSCVESGVMIDGDLKIGQFINDKLVVAGASGAATTNRSLAKSPYTTLTEELTFVATYGGNITPTWKLTTLTANSSGALFSATRNKTNDLLVTFGPVAQQTQDVHNAALIGSAAGTSTRAVMPSTP